jgi:hypothetical protein
MNSKDVELVDDFVASFEKLNSMRADEILDPVSWQLKTGQLDKYGKQIWRPIRQDTAADHLSALYNILPSRFPPLYEKLILSYRWADVDLQLFTLFANPPGPDLKPLLDRISGDKYLWEQLIQAGYLPLGKGPGGDYDPVCFELKSRKQNADFRIVKVSHEEILSFGRLKIAGEVAASFRDLILKTTELAQRTPRDK